MGAPGFFDQAMPPINGTMRMPFDQKFHFDMGEYPKIHQQHKELHHQIIFVLATTVIRMQMHHNGGGFVGSVAQKMKQQGDDIVRLRRTDSCAESEPRHHGY